MTVGNEWVIVLLTVFGWNWSTMMVCDADDDGGSGGGDA